MILRAPKITIQMKTKFSIRYYNNKNFNSKIGVEISKKVADLKRFKNIGNIFMINKLVQIRANSKVNNHSLNQNSKSNEHNS